MGKKAGVALNPATPLSAIEHVIDRLDLILVMTVNPGFGGQSFIKAMLPKITQAKALVAGRNIDIEVDGGIDASTAGAAVRAGANVLVAGKFASSRATMPPISKRCGGGRHSSRREQISATERSRHHRVPGRRRGALS